MALGQRLLDEGGRKRKPQMVCKVTQFSNPHPIFFNVYKKHFGREILQKYLTSGLFS